MDGPLDNNIGHLREIKNQERNELKETDHLIFLLDKNIFDVLLYTFKYFYPRKKHIILLLINFKVNCRGRTTWRPAKEMN